MIFKRAFPRTKFSHVSFSANNINCTINAFIYYPCSDFPTVYIESWLPHLKAGGILAIHDYDKGNVFKGKVKQGQPYPSILHGVDKCVKEILKDKRFSYLDKVESLIAFKKK